MKYTARFVFWHYDEFDTTLANIYDIAVITNDPDEALKTAQERLERETANYSNPGSTDLISITDESGVMRVSSNGQLILLPEKDYDKLPESFCNTGETFFIIDETGVRMRFPKPR